MDIIVRIVHTRCQLMLGSSHCTKGCIGKAAQGCKFSDFNLISAFFTSTPLKTIFEISTFEYI